MPQTKKQAPERQSDLEWITGWLSRLLPKGARITVLRHPHRSVWEIHVGGPIDTVYGILHDKNVKDLRSKTKTWDDIREFFREFASGFLFAFGKDEL